MKLSQPDLQKFFNPRHIAIIGASTGGYKLGGTSFLLKLQEGGYSGKLYPINPKAQEIAGLKAYPDVLALPEVPDLAMVCVSAKYVHSVLEQCAGIGLRHIHILTSGFSETGLEEGRKLEAQIAAVATKNNLLIIGPNCMGPYCPSARLTAWGAIPGLNGSIAIISQSGGLTQRLTEYMYHLGIGVARAVSVGNGTVLNPTDFLEAMVEDDSIDIIAMYLESVADGRRLLKIVKQANLRKPIIIWRGGESSAGAATAASHTGAMSGEKRLWEAFYRQTGVTAVRSMNECMDAIMALSMLPAPSGKGVFIIGGGGGNSVSYSDTCVREGLEVPPLSDATMESLRRSVPLAGSIAGNPFDMWLTFTDANYLAGVLKLAYQDPAVSMVVVDRLVPRKAFHMPEMADPNPEIIAFLKNGNHKKPTAFTIDADGGDTDLAEKGAALRAEFCRAGIPVFPSMRRAARALSHLYRYHSSRNSRESLLK
jgi:acyl-CoA synthetase (NDP forming)